MLLGLFAWRRTLYHRRVVVNLDNGQALMGVVAAQRGDLVVLRDAHVHHQGQRVRMDGEVVVERRRALWYQVVG